MKREYQTIWMAAHSLPQPCHWCHHPVERLGRRQGDGIIHHRDHDRSNNSLANLVIGHTECHVRHHMLTMKPETKAKIAAARLGRTHSPATRAKISVAKKGKPLSAATRAGALAYHTGSRHTTEHKAKIGAALKGRKRGPYNLKPMESCLVCGREFRSLTRHRNRTGH
jgi:hypothetical protein